MPALPDEPFPRVNSRAETTAMIDALPYRPDIKPSGTPCDLTAAQRYLHEQ